MLKGVVRKCAEALRISKVSSHFPPLVRTRSGSKGPDTSVSVCWETPLVSFRV